ncbi:LacI family transcriptional regulator [Leucobacter allii]|uniref:LacI family DNA-binding transcriptional regulator n=1 Tax=Leucobacter allii TaxID=2932247 RepID=UPI001FCFFF7A|nr:LacI family DNA-binding transcriptional regulator [Leucobacter allii]UOR00993.1 LacI family transcriptional regulator [Leucobacter allii]
MTGAGVTIIDIARALGISKTAVSSALHGSGRVSDATRARVLAQAEAMGYVSNRAAQRLRGGQHGAIGLQIPPDVRELAFYMEFAFGVADAAAEAGSDLLLLAAPGASRRSRPAIDGLLSIDPTPEHFPPMLAGLGDVPVVAVGEYRGPERERVTAWIAADHRGLVREVLDELERRGAGSPALVALPSDREPLWASDVTAGYSAWCAERGIDPLVLRSEIDADADALDALLERAAAGGRDGIVWVAQGWVLRAIAVEAVRGAQRFVMATMATEPASAHLVGVDLRPRAYGRAAAALLLRAIDGASAPGEHLVHEARLVAPPVP